jgi:hypothetical protein
MLDLNFRVEKAEPVPHAAAPLLAFQLGIRGQDATTPVQSILLRCQVQIQPGRRRHDAREQERLLDLFDRPERWGQTLRPLLWTHTSMVVPPFTGSTVVDLPVPCTYDFSLAATKYFDALQEGEVPLLLLFSGTIFYQTEEAGLQAAQIPSDKEAGFRLPVQVWKSLMELYYPQSAWLCLRKDVFDRLQDYKSRRGLPTFERALENLLHAESQVTP